MIDLPDEVRALLQVAPGALDANGFYASRQLPDGRWLAVEPQTFGRARLGLVDTGPDLTEALTVHFGYHDVWDYATPGSAIVAMLTWDGQGEPSNWTRHLATGRRRQPDGSIQVRDRELPGELIAQLRAEVAAGAGHECEEWWGEPHGAYANRCVLCDRKR